MCGGGGFMQMTGTADFQLALYASLKGAVPEAQIIPLAEVKLSGWSQRFSCYKCYKAIKKRDLLT